MTYFFQSKKFQFQSNMVKINMTGYQNGQNQIQIHEREEKIYLRQQLLQLNHIHIKHYVLLTMYHVESQI